METELRSNLMACASAFAAARSLSLSTVGRLVAKDGRFFDRLDDGSTCQCRDMRAPISKIYLRLQIILGP